MEGAFRKVSIRVCRYSSLSSTNAVFNSSHQLFTGSGTTKNDRATTPTPSFVELERHSPHPTNTKRHQTYDPYPKTDHELAHASQTNVERRSTMGEANFQRIQGSSRVAKKPQSPAMVNIEEIGTDDIVIAYVIMISTMNCLT